VNVAGHALNLQNAHYLASFVCDGDLIPVTLGYDERALGPG
jgi:hypothetical protein